MNKSEIKAAFEAKDALRIEKYTQLREYLKNVLESNIDNDVAEVVYVNDSTAEIGIKGTERSRTFNLYFHEPWHGEVRKLEINFGCVGSFNKNDTACIRYCEVLGHVAGIIGILEEKMLTSPEAQKIWNEYETARNESWEVKHELENVEREEYLKETELKKADLLSKIAIGTKVMVKQPTKWNPDGIIKTVEHITGKNILFKEDYGRRTRKDELVQELMANRWTIA